MLSNSGTKGDTLYPFIFTFDTHLLISRSSPISPHPHVLLSLWHVDLQGAKKLAETQDSPGEEKQMSAVEPQTITRILIVAPTHSLGPMSWQQRSSALLLLHS